MSEAEHLDYLSRLIALLADAVDELQKQLAPPSYEAERKRYRHGDQSSRLIQVLKAIRAVSALRAALILIQHGYGLEATILFRTVDDNLEDIDFMEIGDETQHQRQFIEHYFEDGGETAEEMLAYQQKSFSVERKKIRAHVARKLQDENPSRVVDLTRTVDDAFSGAVHGSYRSTVEIYNPELARFSTIGMRGTILMPGYRMGLAQYVHRSLNVIGVLAVNMGRSDVAASLKKAREDLEPSQTYTYRRPPQA